MNVDETGPAPGCATSTDFVRLIDAYQCSEEYRSVTRARHVPNVTTEQISQLVINAYNASLRVEEGRFVRLGILFDTRDFDKRATFRFEGGGSPYSVNTLVKLSPAVGLDHHRLFVRPVSDGSSDLVVVGFWNPSLSADRDGFVRQLGEGLHFLSFPARCWHLEVLDPGRLRIAVGLRHFSFAAGTLSRSRSYDRIDAVSQWFSEAALALDLNPSTSSSAFDFLSSALVREFWTRVLKVVANGRHGGCFLILPEQPLNTELRLGYVLNSSTVLEILQRRFSEEVALRIKANDAIQIGDPLGVGTSFHFAERDLEDAVTLLSSLAAVDGAVVLDRRLRIFGFAGEILNTKQVSTDTVRTVSITREVNDSLPLSSFGTRHRSAYRFCCSHPHALAFVISQDGDLRIFASDADGTVLYEGYSPDGWLF